MGMTGSVLTIGKFDGVHAGHAYLLGQVVALAKERGLRPAAMTFDPHPACVVAPSHAPKPLMSLEERVVRIRDLGVERGLRSKVHSGNRQTDPGRIRVALPAG